MRSIRKSQTVINRQLGVMSLSQKTGVRVLSCIVRRRFQATTSEDLVLDVVIFRVCRLVSV
jgi:hypothetical protein